MPTETLAPDAIISSTNLSGAVTDIDDPVEITWTPPDFPSLTGWWDAADLAGQSDGTDVTLLEDKTANNYDFNQRSSNNMPDKETTSGFVHIDFLESNLEVLDTAATLGNLFGTEGLIAAVLQLTGNPSSTESDFFGNNGLIADPGGFFGINAATSSGVPKWRCGIYDGATKQVEFTATTGQRTLVMMYRTSGGVLTASIDGGSESTIASGAPGGQTGVLYLGHGYIDAEYFNGKLFELITSTSNGTSGDRSSLISYLKTKYGIT